MSDKKPAEGKSKETKQQPTRKKLIKVKKLKNTNDMTGVVGGGVFSRQLTGYCAESGAAGASQRGC